MNSERKQRIEIESLAAEYGCSVEIEQTRNGHVKAIFRGNSRASALVMAKGHGGDLRAGKNNLSRARRQLRELTAA